MCGAVFYTHVKRGANSDISTFSIIALMLSIFNIIDLLVSNANNNNNRNNVNDNAQNVNQNGNTESNANPGQSSANQVMMVPPGVGRRKRDIGSPETSQVIMGTSIITSIITACELKICLSSVCLSIKLSLIQN